VVTWPASDQIIIIIIIFLLLLFIFIIIIIIIFIIIILVECYFAAVVCCSVMGVMWFCFCVRSMWPAECATTRSRQSFYQKLNIVKVPTADTALSVRLDGAEIGVPAKMLSIYAAYIFLYSTAHLLRLYNICCSS